ncbi:28S ribosomal protein S26, mitochondrial [Dromiciops gliroides]|uniref:28S ribosomal protein S26, mitochondrial n=1 Tax=Dromiciops gliroides TaxID=33562 RepID=UPI001CC427F9|nr:28S ribosomal protein S26, mitochondrial [Dromiciops gliroides]
MLSIFGRFGRFAVPSVPAPSFPLLLLPARGRKSRHDPPAKSKAGRVRTPTPVDPAEMHVLMERYERYREIVRAIRLDFSEEVRQKTFQEKFGGLKALQDSEEHKQLMAWNQAENARLQALRLSRLQRQEQEQERLRALEEMQKAQEMEAFVREKEREVLQLQEDAKTFITRDNLEEKIEAALDNPQTYNWALTKEGHVIRPGSAGSETQGCRE